MTQSKGELPGFTPGPWVAPEGPFVGGHYVHTKARDADICEMPDWPLGFEHEEEANARLIAAAPELYEALNAIMTHHEQFFVSTFELELADRARAALAKARSHNQSEISSDRGR